MPNTWIIWPSQPALSLLVWAVLAIAAMYLARTPAHRAIRASARVLANALRLSATALMAAQERVSKRNRAVLFSGGRESMERTIAQEFTRVSATVTRDLAAYPAMHRNLSDQITRIDEDYREATEEVDELPSWSGALKLADGMIKKPADPLTAGALKGMAEGTREAHKEALSAYRERTRERHGILKGAMPHWRRLADTLKGVDKTISGLDQRAFNIDQQMHRFEEIVAGTNRAERTLSGSALTQFVVAGLVLAIAGLGGFINFQLIALPMSEMVGASSHLGGMKTSDVAALVIIMVEVAMGLFLMESLRITRLFPVIGALDEPMRKRMIWVTFGILLTLACVESSLAYMRDLLAADREALTQTLSGVAVAQAAFRWIPSLGQMVMGFILPFALTFVAIPLESFIHASRIVLGTVLSATLRVAAFGARFLSAVFHHAGSVLVTAYDLVIFVPLRVETAFVTAQAAARERDRKKAFLGSK